MPLGDYEVDLDFRGDTPADLEGEPVLPPGKYHVIITGAKRQEKADEIPCLRIRYRVLAGTNPAAVGATCTERFYLSDNAKWRLKILANRLGLVKDSEVGVRSGPVDFRPAVGREMVVEIVNEQFVGKKEEQKALTEHRSPVPTLSSKWEKNAFWPPEDQRAAGVPLDPQAATAIRRQLGLSTPGPTAYQPRQTSLPNAQPTAGAYDDV